MNDLSPKLIATPIRRCFHHHRAPRLHGGGRRDLDHIAAQHPLAMLLVRATGGGWPKAMIWP
jgi:hypothetical protein